LQAKLKPTRVEALEGSFLVSISPTFYEQLFHMKVFCAAFMCLQFGFVIFWRKDFGAKAAHKMLVKLTPGLLALPLQHTTLFPNVQKYFLFLIA